MKKTYLFLAEGFEEMEAIAVVDVLRRGGVEVLTVSIYDDYEIVGAHDISVMTDILLEDVGEHGECLIFPGGMPGAENLGNCKPLIEILQRYFDEGKHIAAICAAPALVLSKLKADRKLRLTCYPGFEKYVPEEMEVATDGVVVDGKVITGKGPGFAVQFGLTVLEQLTSPEVAREVAAGMLL